MVPCLIEQFSLSYWHILSVKFPVHSVVFILQYQPVTFTIQPIMWSHTMVMFSAINLRRKSCVFLILLVIYLHMMVWIVNIMVGNAFSHQHKLNLSTRRTLTSKVICLSNSTGHIKSHSSCHHPWISRRWACWRRSFWTMQWIWTMTTTSNPYSHL